MKIEILIRLTAVCLGLSLSSIVYAGKEEALPDSKESPLDVQEYVPVELWGVIFSFIENADDFKKIRLTSKFFRDKSERAAENFLKSLKNNRFVFTFSHPSVITFTKKNLVDNSAGFPFRSTTEFAGVISDCTKPNGFLRGISHFEFSSDYKYWEESSAGGSGLSICFILEKFSQNCITKLLFSAIYFDSNSLFFLSSAIGKLEDLKILKFTDICRFGGPVKPLALALARLLKLEVFNFNIAPINQQDLVDLSSALRKLTNLIGLSITCDISDSDAHLSAGTKDNTAVADLLFGMTKLRSLNLLSDAIDDESLVRVASALVQLTQLTKLTVRAGIGSTVTQIGSATFAAGLSGLVALRQLECDFPFSDSWIASIGCCTALEYFGLICPLTKAQLRQWLPVLRQSKSLQNLKLGPLMDHMDLVGPEWEAIKADLPGVCIGYFAT